jgi:hypothetical protein
MPLAPTRLAVNDTAILVTRVALTREAQATLRGCADIGNALDRLEAAGLASDAVRVLAHALVKPAGVWWACMCAASTAPPDLPDPDRMARETAEHWVREPNDTVGYAAMAWGKAGGSTSPEAWTGIAAFWSGASIAPPGQPPVPPLPDQANHAIAAAVTLAAVRGDGTRHAARLTRFLHSGREIAAGGVGRIQAESGG